MPKKKRPDPKTIALKQNGTLHRRPEMVGDLRFAESEFFDARDLLQVKYEMLRRVDVEGDSITATAIAFGFSRPAFYDAQQAFERDGLAGLIPNRPGPRRAHKLSDEVMSFVDRWLEEDPSRKTSDLLEAIKERFGIEVHRRSVERAKRRRVKKNSVTEADIAPHFTPVSSRNLVDRYEELRRRVVDGKGSAGRSRLLLEQRGLAEWMRAWMADVEMTAVAPAHDASRATPSFDQSEVTMVLATMTLHCLEDSVA